MNKFETPWDFNTNLKLNDVDISYSDVMEIAMGGPVVGTICINGNSIPDFKFGGPVITQNDTIYAPLFTQKWFGVGGFKLAKIDPLTSKVYSAGKTKTLIFLDRVENESIIYYEDMEKSKLKFHNLNDFKEE